MHIIKTTEKINGPMCTRRICRQRIYMPSKYNENVRSLQVSVVGYFGLPLIPIDTINRDGNDLNIVASERLPHSRASRYRESIFYIFNYVKIAHHASF